MDGLRPVPDGSRRKVEGVDKAAVQRDLDELLALRAQSRDPMPRRERLQSFAEVIEAWFEAGCPNVSPTSKSRHARVKSPNTIANAHQLLGASVIPVIGELKVDRTSTERLEELFRSMAARVLATSTIDHNWNYLNQALQFGVRQRRIKTNPAATVLLPERRRPPGQQPAGHRNAAALTTGDEHAGEAGGRNGQHRSAGQDAGERPGRYEGGDGAAD